MSTRVQDGSSGLQMLHQACDGSATRSTDGTPVVASVPAATASAASTATSGKAPVPRRRACVPDVVDHLELTWSDFMFNLISMCIVYAYFSKATAQKESVAAVMLVTSVAGTDMILLASRWLWCAAPIALNLPIASLAVGLCIVSLWANIKLQCHQLACHCESTCYTASESDVIACLQVRSAAQLWLGLVRVSNLSRPAATVCQHLDAVVADCQAGRYCV